MKFRYQYRTKENEVRCGEIAAVDRDAAYAELKAKGIRPSRVEEAPGVLNKLFGKGKRWIAIGLLATASVAAIIEWSVAEREVKAATRVDDTVPRHQIYGDPEMVSRFAHFEGLKSVLGNDGDALLACFAQPGKVAEIGKGRGAWSLLEQSLKGSQPILSSDAREVRELRQIVNWMRCELLAFVNYEEDKRSQPQKLETYFARLIQRTANEKRVFDMIEKELKDCYDDRVREEKNAKLRKLGLPTIAADEK